MLRLSEKYRVFGAMIMGRGGMIRERYNVYPYAGGSFN
jgi:hypothetical protein